MSSKGSGAGGGALGVVVLAVAIVALTWFILDCNVTLPLVDLFDSCHGAQGEAAL